jgi:CRP/FNR family transcriptional regulator
MDSHGTGGDVMNGSKVVDITKLTLSCRGCAAKTHCLPANLNPGEMERFETMIRRRQPLARGDHLFREGEGSDTLYTVKSGSAKAYCMTSDGREQIVGFYLPGDLVGLESLGAENHECSAGALETTSVCELPTLHLLELCHQMPNLRHQLMLRLRKQVFNYQERLLLLGRKSAEQRIATFLISLSSQLKGRGYSAREFNLSLSRQDIANYLGIAVETVSRLFSRLQEEGLIEVSGRFIRINNQQGLERVAQNAAATLASARTSGARNGKTQASRQVSVPSTGRVQA